MAVVWGKLAFEDDVITKATVTTNGDLIVGTGNGTIDRLAAGTDTYVLTANGAAQTLTWESPPGAGAVDTSGTPADNDFAKFTDTDTLEGRSYAETLDDLSGEATSAFSLNEQNLTNVGTIGCDTITIVDGFGISLQEGITFTGATTENLITFTDDTVVALRVEGADNFIYQEFVSTNDSESINFGVDETGIDVVFYSDTAGDNMTWTGSGGVVLTLQGTNGIPVLNVPDGDVVITDTLYFYDDGGGEYISSDDSKLTITGTLQLTGEVTVSDGYSINLEEAITFTGATTVNLIEFPDHLADALSFEESTSHTAYLTFVSTNDSEAVLLGQNLDANFNEALNLVLHNSSAVPGTPTLGGIYYDTDDNSVYICTSTS